MFREQAVKTIIFLTAFLTTTISSPADAPTLEELKSHLFTKTPIVWQAPANQLPKSFWVYQRLLPRIFSATVISNAIVLGSLQGKGFPQPSTNVTCIEVEPPCPCLNVCNFFINPGDAAMSFESPDYKNGSPKGVPGDETIARRAWDYAPQLGLDAAHLKQTSFFAHFYNADQTGNETTNFFCGRGIFLARQLDGVNFFSADNAGDGAEGFSIEFGSHGQIRFFSLRWSNVERYERQQTASPQEIVRCIRAHKTIVLPNVNEKDYFARLQKLADVKKLTITKITPYYCDGVLGEVPTNDVPSKLATPIAELEAVADFGTSNVTVQLLSPIVSSEVNRLLENRAK
jgi:hypothetical protein